MRCPYCGVDDDRVVDSRSAADGSAIRRRRECAICGQRFTTYERVDDVPLVVRKRSGVREPFDRGKLRAGLERAATDRIEAVALDELLEQIERSLRPMGPEVGSDAVGMAVLERLVELDEVAYLRFASVYKGFDDVTDFEREVGELARRHHLDALEKTTAPKTPAP